MNIEEAAWLRLEPRPGETLRAAAERTLRQAMASGALRPGTRLPSSRRLALLWGVSRGVVTEAYGNLAAQGHVVARARAAGLVADLGLPRPPTEPAMAPARRWRYDFSATTPDLTAFPTARWAAAMRQVVLSSPPTAFDYGDPRGEPDLRRALADYLGTARGVVADPEHIVVVQGAAQAVDLLAALLAARGARRVVVNDPGLPSQAERFEAHGLAVIGQGVDAHGLIVDGLDGDAVLTTPAHQFPTGVVLSGPRRRALQRWARERRALVIEDDYDGEFRYDQEAVRALQGLDPEGVAYVGTASKTLGPALRLGWIVLPAALVEDAARVKNLLDAGSPPLEQKALARLFQAGEYQRHVRRMRAVYHRRYDRLLRLLSRHLPDLRVEGAPAGLHVLLGLPAGASDVAVAAEAGRCGLAAAPLSQFGRAAMRPALVLGFGRLREEDMDTAVTLLAAAVRTRVGG